MKRIHKSLHTFPIWKRHVFSIVLSILCITTAIIISFIYHKIVPEHVANISLIFLLALVFIGRWTIGYFYSIASSLICVVLINWIFTYPYFQLNFTLTGYPITFFIMLVISLVISAMTAHLTLQAEIIANRENQLVEAETEKMRANLLRSISHDLRTPLTGIIGSASLLIEKEEDMTTEEKQKIAGNIYEESNWLLHMVENLLTVTRIQGNHSCIKTTEESVEEVIAEALQKFYKRYPDVSVRVHFPEEFIMLPMDAILIEQVSVNLLENAVTHGQSEKPIEIIVENQPEHVVFTIRDYGRGIPANILDHLFDGTAYLANQIRDTRKGMGIGLSLCHTIITAHNGTLIGRNHANGAEFIFTLPKNH